jgi:hypothetical protein
MAADFAKTIILSFQLVWLAAYVCNGTNVRHNVQTWHMISSNHQHVSFRSSPYKGRSCSCAASSVVTLSPKLRRKTKQQPNSLQGAEQNVKTNTERTTIRIAQSPRNPRHWQETSSRPWRPHWPQCCDEGLPYVSRVSRLLSAALRVVAFPAYPKAREMGCETSRNHLDSSPTCGRP